jgi:hypothetical protein
VIINLYQHEIIFGGCPGLIYDPYPGCPSEFLKRLLARQNVASYHIVLELKYQQNNYTANIQREAKEVRKWQELLKPRRAKQ